MFRKVVIAAVAIAFAAPAFANDQLAKSLGVEPGAYSLGELYQIQQATTARDRAVRIELIQKNRENFDTAVRRVMANSAEIISSRAR